MRGSQVSSDSRPTEAIPSDHASLPRKFVERSGREFILCDDGVWRHGASPSSPLQRKIWALSGPKGVFLSVPFLYVYLGGKHTKRRIRRALRHMYRSGYLRRQRLAAPPQRYLYWRTENVFPPR
jgi:hypothetical protein